MTSAALNSNQTSADFFNLNPIKNRKFYPIPEFVIFADIPKTAKIVYGYLVSCYGSDGLIYPRPSTIAAKCNISEQTASRAISSLKKANLIENIYINGIRYYIFLDPDHQEPATQPIKNDECKSSKMMDDPPPAPYIENKNLKKQTTPPRVVVLPDDDLVQKAFDAVPEKFRTPSVKRTIQAGIANHGIDYTLKAVEYTNAKTKTSYGGYLAKTIKNDYASDWTPPAVATKEAEAKQNAERLQKDREDQEILNRRIEAGEHRAALAEDWLKLPAEKQAEAQQEYLSACSPFALKRAKLMSSKQLAASTDFRFFLEKKEAAKND